MIDIFAYLKDNTYPGRGILIGDHEGEKLLAYFIMGRSANSRNRIFVKEEDILYARAYDESKVIDPLLIIYKPLRELEGRIIVSNGDQTDTIYEYLREGKTFEEALNTREYEPDEPNFTPRISGLINENGDYQLSILRKKDDECQRKYYSYTRTLNHGHFISTYDHDGDPLPAFSKDPLMVETALPFEEFVEKLWNSLNHDNRISLYVRIGNKETIYNRNGTE